MGLAHSAVVITFGIAFVAAAGIALPAAIEAEQAIRAAREDARSMEELRDGTVIDTSFALYDPAVDTLVIVAANSGTSALDLDEQVFLFDGVAFYPSEATSEPTSGIWFPGENATFTFTNVAAMPARILLVGPTRSAASLATSAEGVIDTYPVGFELGAGAANSRYFRNMELSTDRSQFTATAKLKNGAEIYVKDVLRVRNPHTASHSVQFTATQATNSYIEQMSWIVKNGGTEIGRLDYKQSNPSLSFTLASGASYTMDFWADLKDGSGDHNANGNFGLTMVVT